MVTEIIATIIVVIMCIIGLLLLRYISLIVCDILQYWTFYVLFSKNKSKEEKDKAYKDLIQRLKNDKWYVFFLSHKPKF